VSDRAPTLHGHRRRRIGRPRWSSAVAPTIAGHGQHVDYGGSDELAYPGGVLEDVKRVLPARYPPATACGGEGRYRSEA
jgi:hypothetical protein